MHWAEQFLHALGEIAQEPERVIGLRTFMYDLCQYFLRQNQLQGASDVVGKPEPVVEEALHRLPTLGLPRGSGTQLVAEGISSSNYRLPETPDWTVSLNLQTAEMDFTAVWLPVRKIGLLVLPGLGVWKSENGLWEPFEPSFCQENPPEAPSSAPLVPNILHSVLGEWRGIGSLTNHFDHRPPRSRTGWETDHYLAAKLVEGLGLSVLNEFGQPDWKDSRSLWAYFAGSREEAFQMVKKRGLRLNAIPGEPCPDCGQELFDPEGSNPTVCLPPTGKEYDYSESWSISLECLACQKTFPTRTNRRVYLADRAIEYRRG